MKNRNKKIAILSPWLWILAISIGMYLYFLLPLTAVAFFELYHLIKIDAIYWCYSFFKVVSYYFSVWEYKLLTCIIISVLTIVVPNAIQLMRQRKIDG